MSNQEVYEFLTDFKTEVKAELMAHTTILDEVIRPDIKGIKDHLEKQNGRIAKAEDAIRERNIVCTAVQQAKERRNNNYKWYVVTSIMFLGLLVGAIKMFPAKAVPARIIYVPVSDSIVKIKPIRLRNLNGTTIDSFHIDYLNDYGTKINTQ